MRKVTLKLRLTTRTFLTIGSGVPPEPIGPDIILANISHEKVILPSSTLKGVLRKSFIKVSKFLDEPTCESLDVKEMETKHNELRKAGKTCITCEVFGGPGIEGMLMVEPLVLEEGVSRLMDFTHVSIDDRYGRAARGRLFTVEYIIPNSNLTTNIHLKLPDDMEKATHYLRLLLLALANLRYERIGRGGLVDVHLTEAEGIDAFLSDNVVKELYDSLLSKQPGAVEK